VVVLAASPPKQPREKRFLGSLRPRTPAEIFLTSALVHPSSALDAMQEPRMEMWYHETIHNSSFTHTPRPNPDKRSVS